MIQHGTSPFLECSSKGDKRFSAFGARIRARGNRTIEDIYQGAKVFADGSTGLGWRQAKGKKCVNQDAVRQLYSKLWDEYLSENPDLASVLTSASGLSDVFGQHGHACQATELWRIRQQILETRKEAMTMFGVASDLQTGLGGMFEAGPYQEFPASDFFDGKIIFKLSANGPRLALDEMKEALQHFDGQVSNLQAVRTYDACAKWAGGQRVPAPSLREATGYDFKDLLISGLGINTNDMDELIERQMSTLPLTSDGVLKVIKTVDELMRDFAYNMKYEKGEERQSAAEETALWANLREILWVKSREHIAPRFPDAVGAAPVPVNAEDAPQFERKRFAFEARSTRPRG